ncbi:MAG: hypothetical protein K2F81_04870 [Ruminococcus sp.]|nr:hypothetical protein [Ruminococcus sp.]
MECPKCKKTVGENDAVCRNCGIALKEPKRKKFNVKRLVNRKKMQASSDLKTVEGRKGLVRQKINENRLKLVLFIISIILIIVLVIVLISHISGEKGNKIALELIEYSGKSVSDAETDVGIHLKDGSSYRGVNTALKFDYVFESEDEVRINDITYPEWAVTVLLDKNEKIESVVYTDFKSVEDDLRGDKKDKDINLDKFDKGAKYSTVTDEIDCDPYSITYKKDNTSYLYKYYYMTDNGDAQQVIINVAFDDENKFLYYSSELVYPENM